MSTAPPSYPDASHTNTYGPGPYPGGQPYMGSSYGGGGPIIVMQQQQQQQQQQAVVRSSGLTHGLCCLVCVLTGGFSIPCWIVYCIVD